MLELQQVPACLQVCLCVYCLAVVVVVVVVILFTLFVLSVGTKNLYSCGLSCLTRSVLRAASRHMVFWCLFVVVVCHNYISFAGFLDRNTGFADQLKTKSYESLSAMRKRCGSVRGAAKNREL